jgi:SAM-dependent methyltransferase
MESISFDRAADYYDRTRSLSDEAMAEMIPLLVDALGGRDRSLEIGVGTGRIAVPLAEAGGRVTGLDLSEPMLAALRAKSSEVPIVVGDATKLPFATDSFPSAIACHVLHLIPNWQAAVEELARVVQPGGALLINLGGWDHGVWRAIEKRFVAEAGIDTPRPGATDPNEVDAVLARFGARVRVLPDVVDRRRLSYGELIDRIEEGLYSFTWGTDEATRVRAARAVREWLTTEHGSLDDVHDKLWIVSWRLYELPGGTAARA